MENQQTEQPPSKSSMGPSTSFRSVEPWDCRRLPGLPEETVQGITQMHQPLGRNLSRSLGVYLSTQIEIQLAAVQEMTYSEFEATFTPGGFLESFRLESQSSPVLVHMDAGVVLPILEILLGGTAETPFSRQELSAIDMRVLSEVSRLVTRELEIFWNNASLRFRSDVDLAQTARHLLPGSSKILTLPLSAKLGEATGTINILLPTPLAKPVMQAIEVHPEKSGETANPGVSASFRESLEQIPVGMELVWPALPIRVRDLASLTPNSFLPLPVQLAQCATLRVSGREMFQALPAKSGPFRAAKIEKRIAIPSGMEENAKCQIN